jgi:hypothetical protein
MNPPATVISSATLLQLRDRCKQNSAEPPCRGRQSGQLASDVELDLEFSTSLDQALRFLMSELLRILIQTQHHSSFQ